MSLSGLRLIATMPPAPYFGGLDRRRAKDQVDALRGLGARVYEFETDAVYRGDRIALQRQIEEIRSFAPHAVIGTPQGGYAVQGGIMPNNGALAHGSPKNLFLDVLELPTLLYWDHVVPQAARYVLQSWPSLPERSQTGVLRRLKA